MTTDAPPPKRKHRKKNTNDEMMKFPEWIALVDKEVRRRSGVGRDDFPDYAFMSAFRSGKSPDRVVDEMIESTRIVLDKKGRPR